ncbi:MAG: alpha/beta hydrolase [Clostridiales bacterium]|nr:alpha/beta hydrolase [Clostridiales bacterium]
MKSNIKTLLKIGAGAAAGVFAAGEAVYECALNTKAAAVTAKFVPLDDERAMEIYLHHPVFSEARKWIRELHLTDTALTDENGKEVHGYILENPEKSNKWVISVHGYRAIPEDMAPYAKHFYEEGYNVLLPCMCGFGHDTSKYCSMGYREKDIVKTWAEWIAGTYPDSEIILHGVSMGSSTVVLTTGETLPENVKCAVADCGYTSCWDAYASVMKSMHIPTFPILNAVDAISKLRGNVDFKKCSAVDAAAKSVTPTLFIHGTGDTTVPFEMMDVMFNACTAEKEKLAVPDALHAASVAADNKLYWDTVEKFIAKYTEQAAAD